jgi:hypothetical protein
VVEGGGIEPTKYRLRKHKTKFKIAVPVFNGKGFVWRRK